MTSWELTGTCLMKVFLITKTDDSDNEMDTLSGLNFAGIKIFAGIKFRVDFNFAHDDNSIFSRGFNFAH